MTTDEKIDTLRAAVAELVSIGREQEGALAMAAEAVENNALHIKALEDRVRELEDTAVRRPTYDA